MARTRSSPPGPGTPHRSARCSALLFALALLPAARAASPPDLPVSGREVPEFDVLEEEVQHFLADHGIWACIVGISRDGVIVYQRAFGYADGSDASGGAGTQPLSEVAVMRTASVEKTFVAATVQALVSEGLLSMNDKVFDLGQPGGGILDLEPYDGNLGDVDLEQVNVRHLIEHYGGWDREISLDPLKETIDIAADMGIPSPADREDIASWMLSQPLDHQPGSTWAYSNFGYMLLGLVVEEVTGDDVQDVVHDRVFRDMGVLVPREEQVFGRSFKSLQDPREPLYDDAALDQNVFDPTGPLVMKPYGGRHHEAYRGVGNMAQGVVPMLEFLHRFHVEYDYVFSDGTVQIGAPLGSFSGSQSHTGTLPGTSAFALQRDDGVCVAVIVNRINQLPGDSTHKGAKLIGEALLDLLDAGAVPVWPTDRVDGFWVDPGASASGFGGHDDPYTDLGDLLADHPGGRARVRLLPGSSTWTGTLSKPMLLDAPEGGSALGK